jgi:hypothetical protein
LTFLLPLANYLSDTNFSIMTRPHISRMLIAVAALAATSFHAQAQYDRDGRYVPSPGGVPRDPYAQVIPGYGGTPGRAIGTPNLPRYLEGQSLPPASGFPSRRTVEPIVVLPSSRPLSLDQCREGWSKSTRVTQTEFRRRCALMERAEERKRSD